MPPAAEADDAYRPRPGRPAWSPEIAPERALRRMIGAPSDGSLDELRVAYDLAMHRATRAGDQQHALALSRAYDRLPITTRDRLYPSSRSAAGGALPPRPPGRTRATFGERPRRRRPSRRRRGFWPRLIVYSTLGLAGLGLIVAGGVQHYRERHAQPPVQQPVVQRGLSTAPTTIGDAPPVIVPVSAPTGANGLVTLVCQPAPGAGGYSMTAPRGAVVACSNGATPTVVG